MRQHWSMAPERHRFLIFLLLPVLAGLVAGAVGPSSAALGAAPAGRAVVSEELRRGIARSSTGVAAVVTAHTRADLRTIRALGIEGRSLRVLPMLLVPRLTAGQLAALERSSAVRSVWHNKRYRFQMEDSTWVIGARYVWGPSAPTQFGEGYTGSGVDIAVIDTGIDGKHEDTDNLVEFCDTALASTGTRDLVVCAGGNDPADSAAARAAAFDDEGHGSHVSGTVAGSGDASGGMAATHSTIGVAPQAELHVYSANVGISLLIFHILAAYDDMTYKKLNEDSGVVATSNSFGGGDGANYSVDDPQNIAIKAAYDAGIVSVYAAGNSGPEHNTLSDSCIDPYVVCVGASTKPDSVVQFSSRGRPSELADTNRNGIVGDDGTNGTPGTGDDIPADVPPDNHDRRLGQRLGIGLYRPTLVAPGVNIDSISANSPTCKEAADPDSGCYEPLNGTSMATPHVSGAIAVIVDAWRQHHGGATPSPATIIDILERSAAAHKFPGYEAEEQGAGRLNVWDAVRYTRGTLALPKPNFGTPSPVYVGGKDPRDTYLTSRLPANVVTGCTGPLSYTVPEDPSAIDEGADVPPSETERFSEHVINVPFDAERLRVTVDWSPYHLATNIYARLWRPGVDPDSEFSSVPNDRAWPDQEGVGLVDEPTILNGMRFLDVRAPERGNWMLRVYHRAGGDPGTCDPPGPDATGGYSYDLYTEIPIAARVPTVAITSPAEGSTHTDRVIVFQGTAGYPTVWDGVTNWEVPGTGIPLGDDVEDPRVQLHFQGNTEEDCGGDGATDLLSATCNGGNGPSLLPKTALSASAAAVWRVPNPVLTTDTERNIYTPNWIWDIDSATTLRGPMTVEWWGSCLSCGPTIGSADWIIRIYADGAKQFEERVTATPSGPLTPTLLSTTVDLPTISASDRFVLHIEPVYVDSQNHVKIYYDSEDACTGGAGTACDSTVLMPVVDPNSTDPEQVRNLRVTDIHTGLRVAFDPAPGATAFEIHRATNPTFIPSAATLLTTLTNPPATCTSPNVPSWPEASDGGAICSTDTATATLVTYYYRVVAKSGPTRADPSLLAYGTESLYDRQVRLKADRLYGPGMWGFARLTNTPGTSWRYNLDTLERPTGGATAGESATLRVIARSYTQGIGSRNVARTIETEGDAPPTPFDPVVVFTKDGPATARAGTRIDYTLSYQNLGPEASSNARVVDTLPAGLIFVSASGNGAWDATRRKVTWPLGTVADGASGTLTIRARIPASADDGTVYLNRAIYKASLTFATPLGTAQTTVIP